MKVEFECDYADFADAYWIISGAEAADKNNLFNYICLYGIVGGVAGVPVLFFAPHWIAALLDFALVFLICLYFFRPPSRRGTAKYYRSVYGDKKYDFAVEIDERGVMIESDSSRSSTPWTKVKEIRETNDDILLIYKYQSGVRIPKIAFGGSSRMGEFVAFATSRIGGAPDNLPERTGV